MNVVWTRHVLRRIDRSVKTRGLWQSVLVGLRVLRHLCVLAVRRLRELLFDAIHDIDTGGIVRHEPAMPGTSQALSLPYEATRWRWFRKSLASFGVDYADFTFVDIGCGKGRALLLASEFPFRRVIGLELDEDLAAVARRNLETYRGSGRPKAIEIEVADAIHWSFPPEPSVVYLYNPIKRDGVVDLVANLERSLERSPRTLVVYYCRPDFRDAFDRSPAFEVASVTKRHVIYQACVSPEGPGP